MKNILLSISFLFFSVLSVIGQDGKVLDLTVHAVSLEGNLIEDSPDLSVGVFLPPGYEDQINKRYPVIYWLHGYSGKGKRIGNAGWNENRVKAVNNLINSGTIKPMIIVMPDGTNKFGGSLYTNSVVTGNWEDFIVDELPKFIDANYRTIAKPESRGIAGHSMGGYGAIKIAMKHPDIFSAVYGTSPAFLARNPNGYAWHEKDIYNALATKSWEEFSKQDFLTKVMIGAAAAFSPNPKNPPFYGNLTCEFDGDTISINGYAKARQLANTPSFMADQYISNLQQLTAISFCAGIKEKVIKVQCKYFSETLTRINVEHSFEIFDGGHNDKVNERIQTKILPFFSDILINEN